MKYFIKISIEGLFPSGVDSLGTYQIPEEMHEQIMKMIETGIYLGGVKRV